MKSAEHWLVHDHTEIELLLRECHNAADVSDWWAVEQFFAKLVILLRYHMAQEEEVLFPAYDAKCESSHMQSQELYNEHSLLVDSFDKLAKNISDKDLVSTIDCIAVIGLELHEHNEKEENVYLPFASHLLFEDRDELAQKLDDFIISDKSRKWPI